MTQQLVQDSGPRVSNIHMSDVSMSDADMSDARPRFLSEADGRALLERVKRLSLGGGYTVVSIASTWTGTIRWARDRISTGGDLRDNQIAVTRNLNGGQGTVLINDTTDTVLLAAAREAERLAYMQPEEPNLDLVTRLPIEPHETFNLFSEATYQLDIEKRASTAITLAAKSTVTDLLSAGDIVVMARSLGLFDTEGRSLYFPFTHAQCRMTVRDSKGTSSGWAGTDNFNWSRIDTNALAERALEKCLQSKDPVRVEPGRYTTILEPQAVGDLVGKLMGAFGIDPMGLATNLGRTSLGLGPFNKTLEPIPYTKLGEQVIDPRLTISSDPADPDLGFSPFSLRPKNFVDKFTVPFYHKVTWIDQGILTHLAYDRQEAILKGENLGLPNSGAFRMNVMGPTSSIDEMISTTKRGILVTRFDQITRLDFTSQLYRGYTRDGLWLIENGKISKAIKNMVFTESVLFVLNNVDQIGVPQRVYHSGTADPTVNEQPRFVPSLKVRDFSFTALTDAI